MARKKKHPEHVNHERWLVSYADFITLLFAFFVVMFAASNSDQKKARQIAQAVQTAFREMAIFDPSGKVVPISDQAGVPMASSSVVGNTQTSLGIAQFMESGKEDGRPPMKEVQKELETLLKEEVANNTIRIKQDARGLTISLSESGFFDPGSAVMHSKALATIDRIAATLRPLSYGMRVEGHTDNTPIHTAQFPSNWELSTARATTVLQYLISSAQIPAPRLSAVGYGEYRPISKNDTAQGRAMNRRVDLVVIGAAAQRLEPQEPETKNTVESH
jgi:chemotaxis protein MotB